jgi:hypothetical protein
MDLKIGESTPASHSLQPRIQRCKMQQIGFFLRTIDKCS